MKAVSLERMFLSINCLFENGSEMLNSKNIYYRSHYIQNLLNSFFRDSVTTLRYGRDETSVIGLLISTNRYVASTFEVTDVGCMRPTHCILL